MKLKKYPYQKGKENNWDEIIEKPGDITVKTFQTGTVKINRRGTINPHHPLAGDVPDVELEVTILAHGVHHEKKGDFLLDTGLDASYITDPQGELIGSSVDEFKLGKGEYIANYVHKNDMELKTVFISHLHADHAAGVRELPLDIPHVIAKGEYEAYKPEIHGNFLGELEELYEIDFQKAQEIPPLGFSVDLLGDGSLWAIWTPGHTPGHMSFLVNGLDRQVLLVMDAAFIYENLTVEVAPSDYTWNVDVAQDSLEKITEFLDKYPQVKVGPGHELLK